VVAPVIGHKNLQTEAVTLLYHLLKSEIKQESSANVDLPFLGNVLYELFYFEE
jgi:hypothetical protein